ncbi:MAG: HDOD domain-containing protein [Candidatus Polarisedimenticolaceae bacterium]|nr:HDOD domain-containing protein [Candidatus Polarisedimenticolaceae bacterium]
MTPQALVKDVEQLVSLPDLFLRINEMIGSQRYSASDIAHVISQDANLSARLLKMVNSSFYGLRGQVDTISRAVTIVGTSELRNLAISTATLEVFVGIPVDLVDMNKFWRSAVSTGVIAKELAAASHVLHPERLFIMGMLHDVGKLVIYQALPELARDIHLIVGDDESLLLDAEQDVLGFTHQEVGYELFKLWQLPESIQTVVRYHHHPFDCSDYALESLLIHLADNLELVGKGSCSLDKVLLNVDHKVWSMTGLDEMKIEEVMGVAPGLITEIEAAIYGGSIDNVCP